MPDLPRHHEPDEAPAPVFVGDPDAGPHLVASTTEDLVELRLRAPLPGPAPGEPVSAREPPSPRAPRNGAPELVLVAGRDPRLGGLLALQFWVGGSCLGGLEASEDPDGHWTLRFHGLGAPG
ncbi:hypothetical protein ACFFRE_04110 [Aciditerrimonas ferrireducens]|jgi:hypothetical protein|uniref:Uncharacterized protein n=1 Tax=Aciditerrimonas ferrireducens TaxID=667306 RepID=A0ABV6C0X6_9ACTN